MSGYAWPLRRPTRDLRQTGLELVLGGAFAALLGLFVARDLFYGFLLPGLLVAVWLTIRDRTAAFALGASIPAVYTVASGHLGLNISVEDLLLALLFLAVIGAAVLGRDGTAFYTLRPLAFPAVQYCLYVFVLLLAHPGPQAVVQAMQRYELVAFPLLIGGYFGLKGVELPLLKAYVLASTALALAWPLFNTGFQKNPAGQFMANAALIVIAVPRLSRYLLCVPLLLFGLFATESRGAIVAFAIGIVVLLVLQWARSPARALLSTGAALAVAVLIFQLMPTGVRDRITTYNSSGTSKAAFTIRFRQQFNHDALVLTRAHPWLGVGVGAYGTASGAANLHLTADPHEVVLLQTAEGGWGFGVSFVVLVLGTVLVLVRRRREELAPAAVAVILATATHGLFDVYWVRGTPVMGWLLAAMVCGAAVRRRREAPE